MRRTENQIVRHGLETFVTFRVALSPSPASQCLKVLRACATVVLPGKFLVQGGNNFWPGVASFCQPSHSFGTDEWGGKSYPRNPSDSFYFFLGVNSSKTCAAGWDGRQDVQISANVSHGARAFRSEYAAGGRGQNADDFRLRRGIP